jgi:signal transduction histidine kinase/CheY-like chemotaxis protein/HPt (histidine-containing phosphotransfer) domain-containing protein
VFRSISSIGLRTRFILIGLAVLVPLVAVMFQLAQYERDSALESAEQRVKLFASLTAERQQGLLQRAEIVLAQLANAWQVRGLENAWQLRVGGEECNRFLASVPSRHPWIAGLRVSALDGRGVCSDGPEVLEPNTSEYRYFNEVVGGKAFVVSDRFISRGAAKPMIVVGVPILDGGRPIGVLSAAIVLETLAELLPADLRDDPAVIVDLIDGNGILLARHPHVPELIGRLGADEPVLERALQKPSGTAELPDLEGAERLFAFEKIDSVDWVVAVGISRAAVIEPIDSALHRRLALIVAIVLSSCVLGLVGGEVFVFWPLRALTRTAQALERGDMAARPHLTGLSEVGTLERSLNRMAEAIQQRESDLMTSQAAWEQAVSDARRANEAKSQFLASMSHEIRTPLSGIVGYNELMLAQKLKPEQRRYAERIMNAAESVISVIDGLLDVSRIEAGEVEIEQRPFSLPALGDNCISMIRPRAESKGLDLTLELDPELPRGVLGDETRLRQVLLNLLTNAVKFTASGSVTLRIHRAEDGARIRFSILDTGMGIAEAQHHRLFKRFSQAHERRRNDGGSGLGLAISKELTELMGGQLGFSSEPNHGSTFWIELALPHTDASRVELRPAPAQSPKAGRILVADDYEMNREITSAMLTLAGHEVDVVVNGVQAVEAVRTKTYDLVLLDIEMHGMNGLEAIGHIRELDPPAGHVPVIAMTANVLPQQVRAFEQAGMDGHLGKPFTRNQLIDKVNVFLSPARAGAGDVARPSASRAAAFDKKALAEMKALIGEQRTAAWIGALRTELEAIVSIDRKLVSRAKLARTAHAMVSQAGSLGFTRLSRLSSELEEACVQRTDYTEILGHVKKACHSALCRIDEIQENDSMAASLVGTEKK